MNIVKIFFANEPIVRTKKDIFLKVPFAIFFCILLGLFPFIIAFAGAWLTKLLIGQDCLNEGSCFWAAIPWLCLMTLPLAFGLFIFIIIKSIMETIKLFKQSNK